MPNAQEKISNLHLRRIRIIIQYDGTGYVGWQVQPNGISIQSVLENALLKITGESIRIHASGRTDSGVHALAQTAHFDTSSKIPGDKFAYALNAHLPLDIRILHSEDAPPTFHSRFDVTAKCYRYIVRLAPHDSAFTRNYALHIHASLDLDVMDAAAKYFLGKHDFLAFKSTGVSIGDTVRLIYESGFTHESNYLIYDVCGSGFMYNMVRIMVGTMLDVGRGYIPLSNIPLALKTGDRRLAGATAPACGLYLSRVEYADFDTAKILGEDNRCLML